MYITKLEERRVNLRDVKGMTLKKRTNGKLTILKD